MVRSSREKLADLRDSVGSQAGWRCEWPGCGETGEQMAHLEHRGFGGSAERNRLDNVAWLCTYHHDIFDRREVRGTREAMRSLLTAYLIERRKNSGPLSSEGS